VTADVRVILSREDGEGSSGVPQEKILRYAQDDMKETLHS
jgi:hypothetical protein